MSRLAKILSAFMVMTLLLLNSSIVCMGYNVINGYANVPSTVETGKEFTVNLQVQCNSSVSVVMFTVVHGDGIKYKSCSVNDGSCGYIEKSYSNNTLTVMYINTKGISAVEKSNLVDIKFKADNYTTNTDIQIFTSNAASSDEQILESGQGNLYGIEIAEKATTSKPAQSKAIKSKKPEKATKGTKSAVDKAVPAQQSKEEATDATDKSMVTVGKSDDTGLFVAGVSFAVAVMLLVFIAYSAGKKKADTKNINES